MSLSLMQRLGGSNLNKALAVLCMVGVVVTAVNIFTEPAGLVLSAQDEQRKADMARLKLALDEYAADHDGHYPAGSSEAGYYSCFDCGWLRAATDAQTGLSYDRNNWIPELVEKGYMTSLPIDPLGGVAPGCSSSGYIYLSGGVGFKLFNWCAPRTGLHESVGEDVYCTRPPYDSAALILNPEGQEPLKDFVDPVRPSWGYAVYTSELACY